MNLGKVQEIRRERDMLHFHEILPAEITGLADAGMGLPRERIPLFDEEKTAKTADSGPSQAK